MSTIIATTLSNGSVSVPTATVVNGSAKAWVNLNGTGTIAARDSFNVASLTDNGTGNYSINFSNAFGAADYAGMVASTNISATTTTYSFTDTPTPTATSMRFFTASSSTGTTGDVAFGMASAHGDLA